MGDERPTSLYADVNTSGSSNDLQDYLRRSTQEDGGQPRFERVNSLRSLARPDSLFSFSKATFASQLAGLTSMTLPQAEALAATVAALPTASQAVRQLTISSSDIEKWTDKAIKVLSKIASEDDVEWAAAAGRDSLEDTDKAVVQFETLIPVYVQAIEELQERPDVSEISSTDLMAVVEQMERTLGDWDTVRKLLKKIHEQVELAMEWEELWGVVLGDVGNELESLGDLVYQMEERRHMAMRADDESKSGNGIDLDELETIVEESPTTAKNKANYRFSLPPAFAATSAQPAAQNPEDDKNLLALFARMQPLRASLDFLPMRLSMFQARAEGLFPGACTELEDKRSRLESIWKQLEKDAENLRRELGEDRWVLVFRNAGRQATKMMESVERSVAKLQEALDTGLHHSNPPSMAKKVESFEAKRMHYGPAIDRVLLIIQKGVKDRLTVNGEILRLHLDLTTRMETLHELMNAMQTSLDILNADRNSQIRDSISTLLSMDRSVSSSFIGTPGSSPASSIVIDGTPQLAPGKVRSSSRSRPPPTQRYSSLPQPRRGSSGLLSSPNSRLTSVSPAPSNRSSATPTPAHRPAPTPLSNKPRWNSSTNTNDLVVGHSFQDLSNRSGQPPRSASRSTSRQSSIPLRSPLSQEASSSPMFSSTQTTMNGRYVRPPSRTTASGTSFAERVAAGQNGIRSSVLDPVPYSKGLRTSSSPIVATTARRQPSTPSTTRPHIRPPSSLQSRTSITTLPYRYSEAPNTNTSSAIASSPPLPPSHSRRDLEGIPSSPPFLPSSPLPGSSPPLPPLEINSSPLAQQEVKTSKARKRMSMLPIPSPSFFGPSATGTGIPKSSTKTSLNGGSGRVSSTGHRPLWR